MRVAYVCADPGVPIFGCKGCSVHVQEVVRALRQHGATVEIFATSVKGDPPPDLAPVPVRVLPALPKGDLADREQRCLAANDDLLAALQGAGRFDLVYERYSLWSYAGMEYARATGISGLLEVNAALIDEQAEYRGLVDRAGAERVAQRVFGAATVLAAVSREVALYLERHECARGRVRVAPNGVNPDRFAVSRPTLLPGDGERFTVGFVGTLKAWHGLSALVAAFALLHQHDRQAQLLVVGDGPERESLVADLTARGLKGAARLTGAVTPGEVPGMLAAMDVAMAPYPELQRFYFSPLKVYEYMASGLPVVASRIGQMAEVITDEVNGLLCPSGDPEALARALLRLRESPELRARLGQAARATVLQHHTWYAVVGHLVQAVGLKPSVVGSGGRTSSRWLGGVQDCEPQEALA